MRSSLALSLSRSLSPARRGALFVVAIASLAIVAVGCGGATPHGATTPSAADYRARAAASPDDPVAALLRAEAELFSTGGDTTQARDAIRRAAELGASPLKTRLLAGIEADLHGRLAEALGAYLGVVSEASTSSDPWAPVIAEVAVASIAEYDDTVPNFVAQVQPIFEAAYASPRIGSRARWAIGNLLADFAYRRGDLEGVSAIATAQRCATSVRVAGPFGPRQLLDFDRRLAPEEAGPLADSYDLGFGRGTRATRDADARGCAIHLGNGPVGGPGTTYAEGSFSVPSGGTYTLRLETPNAVELFVDDRGVARIDRRTDPVGRTTLHALSLSPGEHRFMAKVTTRHPNPVLLFSVLDGDQTDEPELSSDEVRDSEPLARYLDVTRFMARADWIQAREHLGDVDAAITPASMLVLATAIALADPLRAQAVTRDDATRFTSAAARADASAWYPMIQAARFEADNNRVREALAMLRDGMGRYPEVLNFGLSLVDLLNARGWNDQVDPVIAAMRAAVPDACRPRRAALDRANDRGRVADAGALSSELVRCDARSDARLRHLVLQRAWDDALTELHRLATLEPRSSRFGLVDSELTIARGRGDDAAIERALGELGTLSPQSSSVVVAEVDRRLAGGDEPGAQATLHRALTAEPTAMTDLRLLDRAVFHGSLLERYRRDGIAVIRAFAASGRTYENAPQVLVFDYTVTELLPEGTILELTHQIYRAQSEEAVDALGQFQAPDDALLLTLRTVKADGSFREPDRIAGLEHVEMPNLEVGDYVESEYVRVRPPTLAYDGGATGDRFYFQGFEIPFDTSQLTLIVPAGTSVTVDPRGQAPETVVRDEGDTRVYHWEVNESRPLTPEPGSVSAREYLPSIGWSVRAEWPQLIESLRDVLSDRSVRDPAAERLALEVAGAPSASIETRARRLYHWVLENIENTGDVFGQAAPMLSARTGNRARVLVYMLGLAGIDADLAIARSFAFDATESSVPDDDTYGDVLVRIHGTSGPLWVDTDVRRTAMGTLSPLVEGQDALVVGAPFERTRVSAPSLEDGRQSIDVELTLLPGGDARATIVETYRGLTAASWRNELADVPEARLERLFEQNYVARVLPGARMRSLQITGREDPELPLEFRYEIEVEDIGRVQGGARILPTLFPTGLTPAVARLAARTRTEVVPPMARDVRIALHLPAGASAEAPRDATIEGAHGVSAVFTASRTSDGLVLERRVRVPRLRVAAGEYPDFASLCRAVDEQEQRELSVSGAR